MSTKMREANPPAYLIVPGTGWGGLVLCQLG